MLNLKISIQNGSAKVQEKIEKEKELRDSKGDYIQSGLIRTYFIKTKNGSHYRTEKLYIL